MGNFILGFMIGGFFSLLVLSLVITGKESEEENK